MTEDLIEKIRAGKADREEIVEHMERLLSTMSQMAIAIERILDTYDVLEADKSRGDRAIKAYRSIRNA